MDVGRSDVCVLTVVAMIREVDKDGEKACAGSQNKNLNTTEVDYKMFN